MLRGVIFDMDDTLYDEVEYCKSGFRAVAETMAKEQSLADEEGLYKALWFQFCEGNHTATFNAAFDQLGIAYDGEFIRNMVKIYRRHYPSIALPAESKMVLETLNTKYLLGLLTDGYLPAQRLKVQALGIEKYFRCIVYTEELGREYWKPSTAGFERILKQLNLKGDDCVYVADNAAKDFIAPNKLGFKTIQLVRPNRVHFGQAPDENGKARYVIKSLEQLPELLKEIQE